MSGTVDQIIQGSREVIDDCCLANGAIVAANTDMPYYERRASNYRFVWPRDAAFIIEAAERLGMHDVALKFASWLLDRAESFSESGRLFQRYATHGRIDPSFGRQYQPDQAGALLWAFSRAEYRDHGEIQEAVQLIGGNLAGSWDEDRFSEDTWDLWEERSTLPSVGDSFTYTLAACSAGLRRAASMTGNSFWEAVAGEMKERVEQRDGVYTRRSHGLDGTTLDASMLGMVWPFGPKNWDRSVLEATVEQIDGQLRSEQGIKRYMGDQYDGTLEEGQLWNEGAGGWPLLMYWYIIAQADLGRGDRAETLFREYSASFERYIPEQVFSNDKQASIKPLAWGHAMFVLAADRLGYL